MNGVSMRHRTKREYTTEVCASALAGVLTYGPNLFVRFLEGQNGTEFEHFREDENRDQICTIP